jgi:hydroxysqualene synthase
MRSAELRSGKGHRDENFPVASFLIRREHRPAIRAFYEFVRVADDIADHSALGANEKLARLDRLEASLLGRGDEPEGVRLGEILQARALSPRHAQDLLHAFRQDAVKSRYRDWDDLIGYCSYSAMPVGRFVLDVHGEPNSTWPANDALCAALQIINHLQDCGADYRNLDRVYIPLDMLAERGAAVEALGAAHASPALLGCLHDLARRTAVLLDQSAPLPDLVADKRLAMEIAAIRALAKKLVTVLQARDPLRETVHLSKSEALMRGLGAGLAQLRRALVRTASNLYQPRTHEY